MWFLPRNTSSVAQLRQEHLQLGWSSELHSGQRNSNWERPGASTKARISGHGARRARMNEARIGLMPGRRFDPIDYA